MPLGGGAGMASTGPGGADDAGAGPALGKANFFCPAGKGRARILGLPTGLPVFGVGMSEARDDASLTLRLV